MKKAILFSIMASLLLFSCKKDHKNTPDPASKKYKISFNTSGFTQQIVGSVPGKTQINSLNTNAVDVSTGIDNFEYVVFSGITVVHRILQPAGTPGFGVVVDSLPAGTYTIYFAAWRARNVVVNVQNKVIAGAPWYDTFFKKVTLTVAGENVNQDVTLDRIVGQLKVNLSDVLPSNAYSIGIHVNEDMGHYFFDTGSDNNSATGRDFVDTLTTHTGYTHSVFLINNFRPVVVTLYCYDSAKHILAQTIVNNVSIQPNRQTVLTGYLFGQGTGINPGLGQQWNPIPITGQF